MSGIETTVRNIWTDMVQKRLWPVAVALVLLLIAIPVVLAKPAPKGPPPPPPAPTAGPAPLVTTPAAIRSNTGGAKVEGKFHDPFKQLHLAKPASTTPATGPSTGPGSTPGGTPAGGGSPGGSGGSGGSPGGTKHHSSSQDTVKKLKIRFGKADGKLKVMSITPGTPLPAATNPLIVFLDFGKSGKASHWLVSSDVTKTEGDGTGTCKPSTVVCSDLELKPKSTQFFDLANGDQYQLDVLEVLNG